MGIARIYTGPDGKSCWEDLPVESHPEFTKLMEAKGVVFNVNQPGFFADWHPGPRRQFVITLSSEVEIVTGDGVAHRFGAGQVNLIEDLTGQGHTTRVTGSEPRLTATVHLE